MGILPSGRRREPHIMGVFSEEQLGSILLRQKWYHSCRASLSTTHIGGMLSLKRTQIFGTSSNKYLHLEVKGESQSTETNTSSIIHKRNTQVVYVVLVYLHTKYVGGSKGNFLFSWMISHQRKSCDINSAMLIMTFIHTCSTEDNRLMCTINHT